MRPSVLAVVATAALALGACGDDDASTATSAVAEAPSTAPVTPTAAASTAAATGASTPVVSPVVSQDRCEANREAGPITYLSGFDFAAT